MEGGLCCSITVMEMKKLLKEEEEGEEKRGGDSERIEGRKRRTGERRVRLRFL